MEKVVVEKFHRKGKDFVIIIWEHENGNIHQEIYLAQPLHTQDLYKYSTSDALTAAKANIEVWLDSGKL